MLCQLELLTLLSTTRRPTAVIAASPSSVGRSAFRAHQLMAAATAQTLTSLCRVWLRQLGQNFLIANFSVWRFLFLLVV